MLPSRGDQVKPGSLRVVSIMFEVTFAVIKIENELSFPFTILPDYTFSFLTVLFTSFHDNISQLSLLPGITGL